MFNPKKRKEKKIYYNQTLFLFIKKNNYNNKTLFPFMVNRTETVYFCGLNKYSMWTIEFDMKHLKKAEGFIG